MFDIGFSELLMVALVALLVIGPERLPKAARLAGFWIGKSRAMIAALKTEISAELQTEELRQIFNEQLKRQELENVLEETTDTLHTIKKSIFSIAEDSASLTKPPHESE